MTSSFRTLLTTGGCSYYCLTIIPFCLTIDDWITNAGTTTDLMLL